jgi:predicted metalloendopeptidase
MPSLFGLYLMVLSNVDRVFDVNDAMEQIERRKFTHMGVEIETGMNVEQIVFFETELQCNKLCCCSHYCRLENMGIIRNSLTNYNAVIGCDCIMKYELIDRDVYNNEKKKTRKELMKKKKKEVIKQKLMEEKRRCEEEKAEMIREEENIKTQEYEEEQKRRDSRKKDEPIYLVVDCEKSSIDEVKRLGGKWDRDQGPYGLWYIPPYWKYTSELLDKYQVFVIKKKK